MKYEKVDDENMSEKVIVPKTYLEAQKQSLEAQLAEVNAKLAVFVSVEL